MKNRSRNIFVGFIIYSVFWILASNYYLLRFHNTGLYEAIGEPLFWLLFILLIGCGAGVLWWVNNVRIKEEDLDRRLREQQAEHDLIFTQSAVGLLKADFAGVLIECNSYLASMLGYTVDELIGLNFIDITHPDDIPVDLQKRKELNAVNEKEFNYNKRWIHKNGSVVWSNVNGTIQRFENGKIDFFIAAVTNIQPLIEANEALELEKNQTEAMINNSTDIMWSVNRDFRFIKFNKTFENVVTHLSGRTPVEGDVANFLKDNSNLPKDSKEIIDNWGEYYKRALKGESFKVFDKTTINGKDVYYDIVVSPMRDDNNSIYGVSCVGRSITERIELFNALEHSEAKYKDIFENSPVPLFLCNPSSEYVSLANKMARELYGIQEDQIQAVKISSIVAEQDRAQFKEAFQQVANPSSATTTLNIIVKHHYGNIVHQETEMIIHRSPKGGNGDLLIYNMDISERKRLEKEILRAVLETEDKERSRIARELHDGLTQNLTVSSLHFKGIQEDVEASLSPKVYEKFNTALRYLNDSITESRTLSHHIMPKAILDYGLVLSLEQLLGDLENAVDIKFDLIENLKGNRLPSGTELHLYRICQEAIQNIIKYSRAKHAVIQLLIHGNQLTMSIEDDGVGFDLSTSKNESGYGFKTMESRALSLAGRFAIDSSPGKGTIIHISIPIENHE